MPIDLEGFDCFAHSWRVAAAEALQLASETLLRKKEEEKEAANRPKEEKADKEKATQKNYS